MSSQFTETPSLIVTTNSDNSTNTDNLTSLREAITYANSNAGDDAITFDATVFDTAKTITAGSGFTLSGNVTITGPAAGVTIDGDFQAFDIFTVDSGTSGFSGLTILNGNRGILSDGDHYRLHPERQSDRT